MLFVLSVRIIIMVMRFIYGKKGMVNIIVYKKYVIISD